MRYKVYLRPNDAEYKYDVYGDHIWLGVFQAANSDAGIHFQEYFLQHARAGSVRSEAKSAAARRNLANYWANKSSEVLDDDTLKGLV